MKFALVMLRNFRLSCVRFVNLVLNVFLNASGHPLGVPFHDVAQVSPDLGADVTGFLESPLVSDLLRNPFMWFV